MQNHEIPKSKTIGDKLPCRCHSASELEPGPQGLGKSAAMRIDTGKEGGEDTSDCRESQQMLPGISAPR